MADVSFSIRAIDATRAAFVSVQRGLASLSKEAGGFEKGFLKAGLGVVGVTEVMGALRNTITSVRTDIEAVPGLPDHIRESVYLFNDSLEQTGFTLQSLIAKSIAGFQGLGQWIGLTVGELVYGEEAADAARKQIDEQAKSLREVAKLKKEGITADQLKKSELAAEKELAKTRAESFKRTVDLDAALIRIRATYDSLADIKLNAASDSPKDIQARTAATLGQIDALKRESELIKEINERTEQSKKVFAEFGGQMAASFENAVFSGENLRGMLKGIAQDLMRLVFQNLITKPLAGFISGGIMSFFGGGKAAGGSVSAGTPYMVGEKGPELFTPSQAGRIIPNHASGGGSSSGGGVTIQQTNNFSSGIQGVQLAQMLEQNRRATIAEIQRAKQDRKVRL